MSATLVVRAIATDPSQLPATIYAVVVDEKHVLSTTVDIAPFDRSSVTATLHSLPTLAVGRYQGTWQIRLCKDSACATQLAGSPVSLPYDITVTPVPLVASALDFSGTTVRQGENGERTATLGVKATGLDWTLASTVDWLTIDPREASGSGEGYANITFATHDLAVGTYKGAIVVRASDGQTVSVPFSAQVIPTSFSLGSTFLQFSGVNGAVIPPYPLDVRYLTAAQSPWRATTTAPWLTLSQTTGPSPSRISVQPDPRIGPLASGAYSATTTFSSDIVADVLVNTSLILLRPTLSGGGGVTVGGPKGRDLTVAQSTPTPVSIDTGANRWPYTVTNLPTWLTSSTPTGTVDGSGTSIGFVSSAAAPAGSRSATVSVNAAVNGDRVSLPVTVTLDADQRRLLASEYGVGFSSSPVGSVLARTLKIRDNFGGVLSWTATSSASWLSVTSSGSTPTGGGTLSLSANAASLPLDAMSYATVTVQTTTPNVSPVLIRIGLWKGSAAPTATATLAAEYYSIVADPIRPLFYATGRGSSIEIYNPYLGQRVATIPNLGTYLTSMSVSADGSKLYVVDLDAHALVVVDLDTRTKLASLPLIDSLPSPPPVLAIKPNGVDLVLVGGQGAFRDGHNVGRFMFYDDIAARRDGSEIFGWSTRRTLDFSEMSGGMVFLDNSATYPDGFGGFDIAVSRDGTKLYGLGDRRCQIVDASTNLSIGNLPASNGVNNTEALSDGRVLCGVSGVYEPIDLWLWSASGALLRTFKLTGYAKSINDGSLVVTPDGFFGAVLTDEPSIVLVPFGAP
ncbi:hypothetical protein BH10PSE17_BH10PSE17_04940 [soil metagenome]